MVVEGGKESDTDMDRDLEEVEQKQYGSRRSLYDTAHSCLTVEREEGDDDGQPDKIDQMTKLNEKDLLLIMIVEENHKIVMCLL